MNRTDGYEGKTLLGATVNLLASVKAVAAAFAQNCKTREYEQHAVRETRMETALGSCMTSAMELGLY